MFLGFFIENDLCDMIKCMSCLNIYSLLKCTFPYFMLILVPLQLMRLMHANLYVAPACRLLQKLCQRGFSSGVRVDVLLSHALSTETPFASCSNLLFTRGSQSQESCVAFRGEEVELLVSDSG